MFLAGSGCGCGHSPETHELPEDAAPQATSCCSTSVDRTLLNFTDVAVEKVKYFMKEMPGAAGKSLRIAVKAGGCSGYSYDFVFDAPKQNDLEIPAQDLIVLVDPASLRFLKGATVDYVDGLHGAGFVVNNPNSTGGCGCGSSFSA